MSKEKQILQLLRKGYSQRKVADTLSASRNTGAKVVRAVALHPIQESVLDAMEEPELHRILFPEEVLIPVLVTPDFAYIHKELLKSGVTLKLLWEEYVNICRSSGRPPYMYS